MSYGALFASVAGIKAQSNKISIISDNITNVNTVGYKAGTGQFETLVTGSGLVSSYSPGGVLGSNRPLIGKQGLIQGTDVSTDIAISGKGFFVVSSATDGTGDTMFSRAGSFRQDNLGNFRNAAGLYLQGWPLDRQGRLPGAPGNINTNSSSNLSSLTTVNVLAATGSAADTTAVEISANLKASEVIYPGADATAAVDPLTVNSRKPAKSILVPGQLDGTSITGNINSIERGDKIQISTGAGQTYTYRYGGFTYSRDVTSAANGDSARDRVTSPLTITPTNLTLASGAGATTNGSGVVTITSSAHGLSTGDTVTIGNVTGAVNGISASDLTGDFTVTVLTANTFTITAKNSATASSTGTGGNAGITVDKNPFVTTNNSATVTVQLTGHNLAVGDVVSLSGQNAALNGILAGDFNTRFVVKSVPTANTFTIEVATKATSSGTGGTSGISVITRPYNGNVLDAQTATQLFLGTTGTSLFSGDALTFSVTTGTTGKVTFTYTNSTPNAQIKQFNSLTNLAEAINAVSGLTARVSNGRLYVGSADANEAVTFENGSVTGDDSTGAVKAGIDWVRELGLSNIATGDDRFNSLQTLADRVNGSIGLKATVNNALTEASLKINVADPLDTISFADQPNVDPLDPFVSTTPFTTTNGSGVITVTHPTAHGYSTGDRVTLDASALTGTAFNGIAKAAFSGTFTITVTSASTYTVDLNEYAYGTYAATATGATGDDNLVVTPPRNEGSLLAELGLVTSLNKTAYSVPGSLGPLGPEYDPQDSNKNIAGGVIIPQYTQNIRIYDSLGTGHDLKVAFIKLSTNTWAAEMYATNTDEVSDSYAAGLVASGTLTFNGDGSLRSVSNGLATNIGVNWSNGAEPSSIEFNWGTAGEPFGTAGALSIGKTDGMSQFDTSYKVNFVNQNGAAVGQLVSVTIDEKGFVIANYNNGESQSLYKIPIADFSNPDALAGVSGNAYRQGDASGEPSLKEAGTNGAGGIQPSALEASNVELAEQLTDLIVAQRAYQANTKLITTADSLLEELNNTVR